MPTPPRPRRSPHAPRNAVMVDVVVVDDAHRVFVFAQGHEFSGKVLHASGSLAIGDEIHLRLDVEDAESSLILSGEVTGFRSQRQPHSTPLLRGVHVLVLVHRATVRGHDVAPATFVEVAPGRQPKASPASATARRRTEEPEAVGRGARHSLEAHDDTRHATRQNLAFESFHVDDDLDATEVLPPTPPASGRSHLDPPDAFAAFDADGGEDDDTLVMPQVNALPSSILSAPHRKSIPGSSQALPTQKGAPEPDNGRSHRRRAKSSHATGDPLSALPARRTTSDEELTGVTGRLERMGVVEVLQSLEVLGRTGRIDFAPESGAAGAIFVEGGQLRHATFNGLVGREAVVELLQLARGRFRIRFDRTTDARSLEGPSNFLLFDCMRELDERMAAKKNGPVTAVGPAPAPVRDRQARERKRRKARKQEGFHLAPPR